MIRRNLLLQSLFLVFLLMTGCIGSEDSQNQPNIILMMCDDLGWGDTGFNGNEIIKTPHLDQMAQEGALLNHFYSIGPVCSPTRASFLTGRHYYRMGIWSANTGHLPAQEYTIARMLKAEGYETGHFGKWHLGTLSKTISSKGKNRHPEINYAPPWERDYDVSFVTESATATWDPGIGPRAKNNPYYYNGEIETENLLGCDSRVIMDRVIPFIRRAAENETPFLAVIWFHAPHEDIVAGPEYLAQYEAYGEAAHYFGCVTAVDDQVGRLRKELQDLDLDDNTILFFCSDNGPEGRQEAVSLEEMKTNRRAGSAGPFTGRKRSVLDGGVRVPGLALWPGKIEAGREINTPMSVLDYLPTLAELSGGELLDLRILDGENILPVLLGEKEERSGSIPFRFREYACLVKDHYKLIIESKDDNTKDCLYNLNIDTTETINIIMSNSELASEMRTEILDFLSSAEKSHSGAEYETEDYKTVDPWHELGTADKAMQRKQAKKENQ